MLRFCHGSRLTITVLGFIALGIGKAGAGPCLPPTARPEPLRSIDETGDFVLADGRILYPAGILWPSAAEPARRRRLHRDLTVLIGTGPVVVEPAGAPDRWSRQPAYIGLADAGTGEAALLQHRLLATGRVFYWPLASSGPCAADLLQAEQSARSAATGVWSPLHQRKIASQLRRAGPEPMSLSVVLSARVSSIRAGRSVTFVNLVGPRERTPSLSMSRKVTQQMRRSGWNETLWTGRRILVRATIVDAARRRLVIASPAHVQIDEAGVAP